MIADGFCGVARLCTRLRRGAGRAAAFLGAVLTFAIPAAGRCEVPNPGGGAVYTAAADRPCCTAPPARLARGFRERGAAPVAIDVQNGSGLRDRDGLRRDTWFFLGFQAASIAVLYTMPESVSSWSDEQKEDYSLSTWWDNVQNPQWDSDDHAINYLLHPYWGASYYVRARERGYDGEQAFWYSVLLSSLYEFGAEALFEEPSIQDLYVTPVFGTAVGVYFMKVRSGIRDRAEVRGYRSNLDSLLWVLTDPLGSINRQIERMIGRDARLAARPFAAMRAPVGGPFIRPAEARREKTIGLEFSLRW